MNYLKAIKTFLSQPFLMWEYTIKRKVIATIFIVVFSGFFVYFFTPFSYNHLPNEDLLIQVLLHTLLNIIVVSFFYFVIPLGFNGYFRDENRTIFREAVWVVALVLCSAAGHNQIDIFDKLPMQTGPNALWYTVTIGIFPFFTLLLLAIVRKAKEGQVKHADLAHQLIEITANVGKDKIKLFLKDILYIKSLDNYSEVYYTKDNEIKMKLFRISLNAMEGQLVSKYFSRCHRSFILNLYHIELFKGNVNNSRIHLKGNDIVIPVSKSRRSEVLDKINELPVSYSM